MSANDEALVYAWKMNDLIETAYWKFVKLQDQTQTETPASSRDAFKQVVCELLIQCVEVVRKNDDAKGRQESR